MANTFELIASYTAASSQSSITFSSIASSWTDIQAVLSVRSSDTSVNEGNYDSLLFRFNGSTSNYSGRELATYAGSAYSGTTITATSTAAGGTWARITGVGINNSNSTSSTFSSCQMYIPNAFGSTNKSYSFDGAEEQNQSSNSLFLVAGLWSDTSAINSIAFALKDGSFVTNSTIYLYGVKNA